MSEPFPLPEADARRDADRFRRMVESVPEIAWTATPDGALDYYNDRWYEVTGERRGMTGDESWGPVVHPEDLPGVAERYGRAIATGEPYEAELRLRNSDGTYRWYVSRARPWRDDSGAIERWFGVTTDIHDQKRDALALGVAFRLGTELSSELDSDRVVQAVTDASTEAIDSQFGAFFYAKPADEPGPDGNPRFGLYVLSGAPIEAFSSFPPVRSTPLFSPTFHGEGTVRSDDIALDSRFSGMPAGHLPVRSYLAVTVRARDGGVLGGLLFGHEDPGRFTADHELLVESFAAQASVAYENALLVEQLRDAKEGLERRVEERTAALLRANRDLREFSQSVAHDLRTPLRAIVSTSRILREDASERLTDSERRDLERQEKSAVRLAGLVDDLLKFARLAGASLVKEEIDFTALARKVGEEVIARRNSKCVIEVAEGLTAHADPALLGYALDNIIDNACKFSHDVGPVRIFREGEEYVVADEGAGFDMAFAHKLFVAFERLVDQEAFEGTGVGLANVARIVERHGGRIRAESEPGRGATFRFTLQGGGEDRPLRGRFATPGGVSTL